MNNINLNEEDIKALGKIVDLIEVFHDKTPIRQKRFNFKRLRSKITINLKENPQQFLRILKKLNSMIKREAFPEIYYLFGGHGGIIIDGIGFCEFDFPEYAMLQLLKRMELAIETKMPFNIEVAISSLEWIQENSPDLFEKFRTLMKHDNFQIINPSYAQPYSMTIGPESNIKHLEYGLNFLEKNGLNCDIYWASECSVHPQIPQILKMMNIRHGSLRTRLLGVNPTTISGNIGWIGLDDTAIQTITDISGIFNGEIFHGIFFKEIPEFLFQAVSRPFLEYLVFSSLEDFVMPLEYNEEVWRVSNKLNLFGKFLKATDFLHYTEKNGEYKFKRDEFFLGSYIYIPKELFYYTKVVESKIISLEMLNLIFNQQSEVLNDDVLENLWKRFLLTQAHDNYAVPYVRNGDYSENQLSKRELDQLHLPKERIKISDHSLNILKDVDQQCEGLIEQVLHGIALKNLKSEEDGGSHLLIFNPSAHPRENIVEIKNSINDHENRILKTAENEGIPFVREGGTIKLISSVPAFGYAIYSFERWNGEQNVEKLMNYFYKIGLSEEKKAVQFTSGTDLAFSIRFQAKKDYILDIVEDNRNPVENYIKIKGKFDISSFDLEIRQYNNQKRIDCRLGAKKLSQVILKPAMHITNSFINYPFGIEKTKRTEIQALDFIWLRGTSGGILYNQKNAQKFKINRESFEIMNILSGDGIYEFSIRLTGAEDLDKIHNYSQEYFYPLLGTEFQGSLGASERIMSFLTLNPPLSLINAWKRKGQSFLRIFNPSSKKSVIKLEGELVNSKSRLKARLPTDVKPWKILTIDL